ncbi:MAG: hypothetical protein HDR02_18880 [Lachnospiraceae bacterium]|nr:hypothetical protein [Lachnospiraceae bacterium]
MEIEVEGDAVNYDVAAFWGYYLLLVKYFDYGELFGDIKNFLQIDLAKASKCVWFLRKNEELLFYEPYAMNLAGEGIEINVEKNFETFSAKVEFIVQQYENEIFSFDEYSFENLEVIICRYYGYIPRVKFKMQEE